MYSDDIIQEMYRAGREMGKNINALLKTTPFRPFTIHMNGKWVHEITDSGMIEVRDCVADIKSGGQVRAIIALMHVISLTVHAPLPDEPVILDREVTKEE